ncbi:carbonic anhydrase [Methanoregula sp. UBA64]|jgi:carbonic anhydrase|uniref:carbonic anhydrase n=1 Tax=Methanoregula sp. UBA64 TaxID=1915554 RepID=UPI0025F9F5A5|nr:carbonic anhydrase [Methanoregula sp. UBA64]
MIDNLLLGNDKFRESDFTQNIDHYRDLVEAQHPKVLWLGCSDSRVNPERITEARAGEIFVQRNIGNIVPDHDWNFATVLEFAIVHLRVEDIVICGHSDCGAIKAMDMQTTDAYIPLWLSNARVAKERVDAKMPTPKTPDEIKARFTAIEQENVKLQLEHLLTYPLVKNAVAEGKIQVHGLYYDLETGVLNRIC